MKLFEILNGPLDEINVSMTFTKKGDLVTVSVLPQIKDNKEANESIIPFILTGTVEELTENFEARLEKPMVNTAGIATNVQAYAKQMKAIEAAAAEKAKVAAEKKKVTKTSEKKETKSESSGLFETPKSPEVEEEEEAEDEG
jgi:PRTRC genetic system protein E